MFAHTLFVNSVHTQHVKPGSFTSSHLLTPLNCVGGPRATMCFLIYSSVYQRPSFPLKFASWVVKEAQIELNVLI